MAVGSITFSAIVVPDTTGSLAPDYVARNLVAQMLQQVIQTIGDGKTTSGNLTNPMVAGSAPPVQGTWVYVKPA